MRLLAVDDLVMSDLGVPELPLITSRSTRLEYGVRRREGVAGSVYFGGQPETATWVVTFKLPDLAARDAVLTALGSDLSQERRLLAQRLDPAGTLVRTRAALVKIVEANALDLVVDFESDDSVWTSDADETARKIFTSSLDNALAVPVPGNTRTRPVVVLTPNVQRTAPSATVGWTKRRRYVISNLSLVPWLRVPYRLSLGDTTTLVTSGRARSDGADLRIVIDGVEVQRTLVGWNTSASYAWLILEQVAAQSSLTVEVWYGNSAATGAAVLAYPNLPPFNLSSSTNAAWVYNTQPIAANKGLGLWQLFGSVLGAAHDLTVPGAWRPSGTLLNLDNEDDHAQPGVMGYTDAGTWAMASLAAWRAAPGTDNFPIARNPNDGVGVYHPFGITSVACGFRMLNENAVGALVSMSRDSAAGDWQATVIYSSALAVVTPIAYAQYVAASPVKHWALGLWPFNGNYIADGQVGLSFIALNSDLTMTIDTSNVAVSGGTEEDIYEIATTLRVGGGANGAPPYRSVHIGNATAVSGAGTPRASVLLDTQALIVDATDRTHEVWGLVPSSAPWTPADLGGLLKAWYKADAITGYASGALLDLWVDSSPNGLNADAAGAFRPTYLTGQINGRPAVSFNRAHWMNTALSGSSLREWIFAVISVADTINPHTILGSSATGGRQFEVVTSRQLRYAKQNVAAIDDSTMLITLGTATIVAGYLGTTTGRQQINALEETFTHAQTLTAGLASMIGAAGGLGEEYSGLIAEIVVCADLTPDKINRLNGYLAAKYGLSAALPVGHPFRLAVPMQPIPGSKVENLSIHAVEPLVGWDDGGVTRETPANDWLPLVPLRDVMVDGGFAGGIPDWSASVSEAVVYNSQVGTPGSGPSQFNDVRGLDLASTGDVWAVDTNNEGVKRFSPTLVSNGNVTSAGAGSGDGQFASDNGAWDVAVDGADNVSVSDRGNQRIQTFNGTTGAWMSKLAGSSLPFVQRSVVGGLGSSFSPVRLSNPIQIAYRQDLNWFGVADYNNGRFILFTPDGTYVGYATAPQAYGIAYDTTGNVYYNFGWNGPSATVNSYPPSGTPVRWSINFAGFTAYGLGLDWSGNPWLWICDQNKTSGVYRVGKWNKDTGAFIGQIAASGGGPGQFFQPVHAVSQGGFLYVSDNGNKRIQKFNATTLAWIETWSFNWTPWGLAFDAGGNLLVCDHNSAVMRRFSTAGVLLETLAVPGGCLSVAMVPSQDAPWIATYTGNTVVHFDRPLAQPEGIAVRKSTGRRYVTDTINHCVDILSDATTYLGTFGGYGTALGQLNRPVDVAVNQFTGDVYVVDQGNARIMQYTGDGAPIRSWGSAGTGNGQFLNPTALAINQSNGDVSVIDSGRDVIQRFTSTGTFIVAFAGPGTGNGQLDDPSGIAVSSNGAIVYTSDKGPERIQRFNASPIGSVGFDPTVGGIDDGSLMVGVATTPGVTGIVARAISNAWHPLNFRESVQVAGWVRTNNAPLVPLLQIEFADENAVVLATATEPLWSPVPLREYRRTFAARAPDRVTQYRIALAAYAVNTGATGTCWFDDLSINASELVVRDQAMGEVQIDVAVRGAWIG